MSNDIDRRNVSSYDTQSAVPRRNMMFHKLVNSQKWHVDKFMSQIFQGRKFTFEQNLLGVELIVQVLMGYATEQLTRKICRH